MKLLLFRIKVAVLKLSKYLGGVHRSNKEGFSGLGQFVVLITLAPFIFDLSLYRIGSQQVVPSHYEYGANRFESLPAYPALGKAPKPPARPKNLTAKELKTLNNCPLFINLSIVSFNHKQIVSLCKQLKNKKSNYEKLKKRYPTALATYQKNRDAYKAKVQQQKEAKAAYEEFRPDLKNKPHPTSDDIKVRQTSSRSITALLGSSIAIDVRQGIDNVFWWLGALLIGPAIWLSFRHRCWSLLIFGLSVPALNYALFMSGLMPAWAILSSWAVHSTLAAQVAFVWFAVKGHITSKSFLLFALLLSITVSWAALSIGGGLSVVQAHLPIVIFVVAAALGRLVVVGLKENGYLFVGRGWLINCKQAGHAFLLWLPLAVCAASLLYFTEIMLPKAVVNELHNDGKGVLRFAHGHDILDNALQSAAEKTDTAMYAWHLSIENIKLDIYRQGRKLQNTDLVKRVEETFDQVMPGQLDFDGYKSHKVIIGPAVELAVGASQDTTNDAFIKMRDDLKEKLSKVAADKENRFKDEVKKGTTQALKIMDEVYEEGAEKLLEANRSTQSSLWWAINYARAAHMLSTLLFLFVCMKSYVYVFSRVSFHRKTGTFVTLGDTSPDIVPSRSRIASTGLQYVIHGGEAETFYISRRFQSRGKAPRYNIPQPSKAILARLRHGAYSMNKVEMKPGDDDVRCSATRGVEFFEWELGPGEVVLFDFYNFVGMSETIQLSTHISTRASSLLLGKMIRSQATGPGKLILKAEGRAEVTDEELHGGSLPPERIIASHLNTRFHVDSELDLVNVYLSTAYVRPAGGGQVIVDVDSQRGNKTGLGSFFRRFILPV